MSGKTKILLVDDEKTLVKALKFNLEKEGFQVEEAFDGEEALKKAFEVNPDIIILDLMLPGLDGFEVCREIRKKKEIPIIMLTAKGEDIDKVSAWSWANDYIQTLQSEELVARIKAILRRSSAGVPSCANRSRPAAVDRPVAAPGPFKGAGDRSDGKGVRASQPAGLQRRSGLLPGSASGADLGV